MATLLVYAKLARSDVLRRERYVTPFIKSYPHNIFPSFLLNNTLRITGKYIFLRINTMHQRRDCLSNSGALSEFCFTI